MGLGSESGSERPPAAVPPRFAEGAYKPARPGLTTDALRLDSRPAETRRGDWVMALTLDSAEITATIARLQQRIEERFPDSNLGRLCGELLRMAQAAEHRAAWIRRPLLPLRLAVGSSIVAAILLLWAGLRVIPVRVGGIDLGELVQGFEAALSSILLVGAAIFFLITLEIRLKRGRALRGLHELRIVAHVVDLYQLTKDPVDPRVPVPPTRSSPKRDMTPHELARYLDYSSEMLALTTKIGVLYVSDFADPTVLAGVDALQRLIDGLSQKIWHKAALVDRIVASLDEPKQLAPATC